MAIPGPASSQQSATQDPLRININSGSSNHQISGNGQQQSSLSGPKTSTGIPNDVANYAGKYNKGYTAQERKPSPVQLLQGNGSSSNVNQHPKSAPLRKDSGFKLPSIAYSPNINQHEDSDEEEDIDADEEDEDSHSPPRRIETRSTMTLAPPKLPLLFFEEDNIGTIDFAYQTSGAPSSTHSQTDLVLENNNPAETISRSSPAPDARGSPSGRITKTTINVNETDPSAERRTSPRPFTPRIDTTSKNHRVVLPSAEQFQSPEKEDGDTSGSQGARNHSSFYWQHSSGSSEDEDDEDEDLAEKKKSHTMDQETSSSNHKGKDKSETPAERLREPLILKPFIPSLPENGLTSATALGFGGPSDWQHFTDYNAEEVDDLALYTSGKPKTVELPAGTPVKEEADKLESALSPRRLMVTERDPLPTIQERTSEVIDDARSTDEAKGTASVRDSAITATTSTGSPRRLTPDDDNMRSSSAMESDVASRKVRPRRRNNRGNQRTRLGCLTCKARRVKCDETKPNCRRCEDFGRVCEGYPDPSTLQDQHPSSSSPNATGSGGASRSNSPSSRSSIESDETRKSTENQAQAQAPIPQIDRDVKEPTQEKKAPESKAAGPLLDPDKKGPIPAHLTNGRVISNNSIQSSGLNSPIDEDDGRERIIISLQVPDSPEPEKAKEPSPPPANIPDAKPRERNLAVATNLEPRMVESPDILRTGRMSVFHQSIEMDDPYAGLDTWAKASLNRYVKLLKEEAAAQTDEEKFTLFITFMDRERRNRTALYDMDEDSENESTVQFNKVADGKGGLRSRVSLKRKAAPVVPSVDTMPAPNPQAPQPVRADTLPVERSTASAERKGSDDITDGGVTTTQPPMTAPPQQSSFAGNGTADDTFVMVDNPVEEKPVQQKIKQVKEKGSGNLTERESPVVKDRSSVSAKEKLSGKTGLSLSALKKKALDLGGRSIAKDRNTTPINLQTLLTKASDDSKKPASPLNKNAQQTPPPANGSEASVNAPLATDKRDNKLSSPEKNEKNEEAEGRAYEGDKAANRQTIYRPFSGLLRQSSVLRGSNPESKRSSVFDRKSLAAEVAMSRSPINPNDKPFEEHQKPRSQPVNYRYTILEPLLLVIPQEGVTHTENSQLIHLRQRMDAIRDDFSFIHKTVLTWDSEAKKNRENNERERHARTTQNETRIDDLFNGNEIGYGDISQLEADFKRQEATMKADEDRKEVETFVTNVFDVVWARINYEMDELQPLYEQCTELVSHASAGRTMFEDFEDSIPVAPGMEILLILYQKLMVRHQKAFEAVLERDRRLKKTEVAPWYALGSMEKVKKIEKRFEDAEKKAILEFCRQRDERANLLMDVLDQNTLRGVGANQDYMESIMQAVRNISLEVQANGSNVSNDDVVSIDEVLKAKTITTALARSSEQIVQTFHVADMLLNAADYEVSVANAKLSNADAAAFKRLREAKAKEDNKLAMDLEHRMSLIRGDTTRTQEEISKLLALISKKDNGGEALRNDSEPSSATASESQDRTSRLFSRGNDDTPKGRRIPRKT